jgi:hypothetical protein
MGNVDARSHFQQAKKDGLEVENLFEATLTQKGCKVVRASRHEDIHKHIDFYVNGMGVDVKAKRALDKIWLEMENVSGNDGWLKGSAEYIAFHFKDFNHFKLFRREDLRRFVEENVTETCTTSTPFMKFYTRAGWNRKDKIVKVSYNHIKHLYHFIVKC